MQADTYLGTASDPLSLNLYTYCLNNPHKYTDPSGHFAITAGIVIGAIIWGLVGAGIEYKMQKDAGGIIDYNHVIFQGTLNMAIAVISGGTANGMMAAQQGTRMTARTFGRMMLMEAGFGVAEGIIGETGYQLIEGKKLKDLSAGKNAIKSGFAKFAKKNGKVVEVDTEFRQTFYQVTSKEDAKTIMKDNVLIGKEFKEVYAWKVQPTLKQVSDSGARSMETVISFEVHPNVFTRDPHIHKSLENIAMISVRPAPIAVSNVKEVGFKKEWWKFWKQ